METTLLKNGLLIIMLLFASLIKAQIVNIPDAEFKQALLSYSPSIDTNNDNNISVQEAAAVTSLTITDYQYFMDHGMVDPITGDMVMPGGEFYGISDFTGIEAFVNLTYLNCRNNDLSSLDISALTQLTYLDCSNNINYNTAPYQTGISALTLPNSNTLTTIICSYNNLTTLNASAFTSLSVLNATSNSLQTLTLPNSNSLTSLSCDRNQLTTLDVSSQTSLISLVCNNNLINALTLPNTPTLTTLKCYVNQIPMLNVSNNTGLNHLDCRNNPITTLNVLQNTALKALNCSSMQLTSLDLTNNTLLNTLACGGNQIMSLDLSRQTSLNTLYCNNNQLNRLNIKNGNNNTINSNKFDARSNPNLKLICVDDLSYANSTFTKKDAQSFYSNLCSFIPTNSNTITGKVSFDFDANGCDSSDTKSINTKITNTSNNTSNVTFTNNGGQYVMYTQEASNNVEIFLNLPSFFTVTPTTQTSTFTGSGDTNNVDFCITANQVVNDVKVTVIPTFEARPGFDTSVRVYYENVGSSILSGTIELAFLDTQLNFLNATVSPNTQTNNLLTWNYTNLKPFENNYIDVHFNINTPVDAVNPVNGGDSITYTSTITTTVTDVNLDNNTSISTEPVVNSHDPNDIICFEGDYIDAVEIPNFLNYRVRFQNTGSASAINIVVKNELDADLDWDTFTPISASHNYRPKITDGNKLEFIFENIHLADSISNEPESHGWVYFKVKPKSTLALVDIVENTSYIYFDYNAPVITNTATTQLTTIASLTTTMADNISQTGANLAGNISANGGAFISERGIVYAETSKNANPEIGGTDVIKISNGTGIGTFNSSISNLITNTSYSFKSYAINSAGINYGNLEIFTTSSTTASIADEFVNDNLKLFPNPVNEFLAIKTSDLLMVIEVSIYNILGKRILKKNSEKPINVSNLNAGIYFVKINTDKGIGIKKIIKK